MIYICKVSYSNGLHAVEGSIIVGDALSERIQSAGTTSYGYVSECTVNVFLMNTVRNDSILSCFPFRFVEVSNKIIFQSTELNSKVILVGYYEVYFYNQERRNVSMAGGLCFHYMRKGIATPLHYYN